MRTTLRVTRALSDPQRLRILLMLGAAELCVCRIVEALRLAPSTVSKHLSILAEADLVTSHKEGRWIYYRRPNSARNHVVGPALRWVMAMLDRDPIIQADRKALSKIVSMAPETLCRRQRERKKEFQSPSDRGDPATWTKKL